MDQIILGPDGEAFQSREHALEYARQHELSAKPVKHNGAWTLQRTAPPAAPRPEGGGAPARYFRVIFNPKGSANETDDVQLCVNGDWLICQREQPVIIPEAYLNAARDARRIMYATVPGQPLKRLNPIMEYSFRIEGSATHEEYLASKKGADAVGVA
jgi:hypothetical protein